MDFVTALLTFRGRAVHAPNFVDSFLNNIKAKIDEWGAKLNPLCIQGEFAESLVDKDGNKVEESCKVGTSLATSAAMTSAGLPPSLPNSDQRKDDAYDAAIDYAAEQAEVECDVDCKALMKKEVGKIVEEAKEQTVSSRTCLQEELAPHLGSVPNRTCYI